MGVGRSAGTIQKMRMAVHSVAVALRMLARPLVILSSPQAIAAHGSSALMTAMMANGSRRLFQLGPNTGRRSARIRTTRATAPDTERTRTNPVGPMSPTPSLMNRNETPHIRARATNAAYGRNGVLASDTRRPVGGGAHEGDRPVVLDAHAHNRPEAPSARLYSTLSEPLHENLVELLRARGVSGLQQARPPAFAHVGKEGELRHDQSRALDVDEAQVHPPRLVCEHAEVDDLVREALHRTFVVLTACTHQQHKSVADGCTVAFPA